MRYNSLLELIFILSIFIIIIEAIETLSTDPCKAMFDLLQQPLGHYDDGVTGHSTKACHEACNIDSSKGYDSNGMCVYDRCYCTEVGVGTCQDNNHEGCDAICQNLSLDWIGVCSEGGCHCLY